LSLLLVFGDNKGSDEHGELPEPCKVEVPVHPLHEPGNYKEKMKMIKEVRSFAKDEVKQRMQEVRRQKAEQEKLATFPDEAETQRRRLAIRRSREARASPKVGGLKLVAK